MNKDCDICYIKSQGEKCKTCSLCMCRACQVELEKGKAWLKCPQCSKNFANNNVLSGNDKSQSLLAIGLSDFSMTLIAMGLADAFRIDA